MAYVGVAGFHDRIRIRDSDSGIVLARDSVQSARDSEKEYRASDAYVDESDTNIKATATPVHQEFFDPRPSVSPFFPPHTKTKVVYTIVLLV